MYVFPLRLACSISSHSATSLTDAPNAAVIVNFSSKKAMKYCGQLWGIQTIAVGKLKKFDNFF